MTSRRAISILYVEDSPLERIGGREVLAAEGFEVETASSVRSGARAFAAGSFDVALLDYELADGDALDLIRLAGIPVDRAVVVTGAPSPAVPDGVPVLRKPIDLDRLVGVLEAVAAKGRAGDDAR